MSRVGVLHVILWAMLYLLPVNTDGPVAMHPSHVL